jgi:electron transfer flavoprotein alpha subunit
MSVLVFIENWDGKFKKLTFELVSYCVKVAEMTNTSAVALSIGNVETPELENLGKYGVRKIVNVANPDLKVFDTQAYASVIAQVAAREQATVILLSHNNTGKALAPRLAIRLKAGIGSGISKLPLSIQPFTVYKKVFSGKAFAQLVIKSDLKILTLSQNSFEVIENPGNVTVENVMVQPETGLITTQVKDVQKQTGKLLLTDAEIVVSGGRGMKSPDNWGPLVELAELLGGATACSRPVSDEGWRPHEEHTGQTGKIIAPNLYFAFGISGATQHIAGVSSSKYIVAVNIDKDAPVFEAAQYGIVGDAQKILPKLVEAVKELKSR